MDGEIAINKHTNDSIQILSQNKETVILLYSSEKYKNVIFVLTDNVENIDENERAINQVCYEYEREFAFTVALKTSTPYIFMRQDILNDIFQNVEAQNLESFDEAVYNRFEQYCKTKCYPDMQESIQIIIEMPMNFEAVFNAFKEWKKETMEGDY